MNNNFRHNPVKTYNNAFTDKNNILKKNKNKYLVYRFFYKIDAKSYMGSLVNFY